jgi:allantoate deiminase
VVPILAVDALRRAKALPPIGIELVAFGDEEGSRFPSTLSTSAVVAGCFDAKQLALKDSDGMTFAEALRAYGKDPDKIAGAAIPPGEAAAYVEAHIEQGPVLEDQGEPLGVVTAIVGQTRLQITVAGTAGHAGTVPMRLRHDALAGAAEMIQLAEQIAHEFAGHAVVATVGRIEAQPGAINIIPALVRFTLDLRAASDTARDSAIEGFAAGCRAIAERRRLGVAIDPIHRIATTPADETIQAGLARAVEEIGAKPVAIPSGAGHDGLMMSKLCPFGMLFVRCKAGVSHNPAEHAAALDMGAAVAAIMRFIQNFKPD